MGTVDGGGIGDFDMDPRIGAVELIKVGNQKVPANGIAGGTGEHAGEPGSYGFRKEFNLTTSASDAAKQWDGWGTNLKPAIEPILLCRKPLDGTVANNVLAHGVGGLNIDACRVPSAEPAPAGRWPANVLLDEHAAKEMNNQSEDSSRFFPVFKYQAKAPKKERPVIEREDGTKIQHPTVKPLTLLEWLVELITPPGGVVLDPFAGSGTTLQAALNKGFTPIGIEQDADYIKLIEKRLEGTCTTHKN